MTTHCINDTTHPSYHITVLDNSVQMASVATVNPLPYLKLLCKEYEGYSIIVTKFVINDKEDSRNTIIWEGTASSDMISDIKDELKE